MKKVMAFGTFDIFHPGHRSYLEQSKEAGDYLIVVVARDKTVLKIKKQRTANSEQKRLKNVKISSLADKVVLGNLKNKYAVVKKFQPDIIALGYDQKVDLKELEDKLKGFHLKTNIIRLKACKPEIYKSSKLRK
jgi:FAD synthetase